ncbi:MAG: thiamine diphosphokinase [Candidatus Thermoplasmatota archaeon]|jgi:thiamine pyrophosphokinase|nr:thiamine diphosphokinase [Candidatus Thermoplasmatota archaeon]MEC7493917.1 thiamine diphosphokinase [Candidatus Thermoplasmatota archaeon]MEC8077402.1 thiamine diphosphokinase [Candidatus Thermoplasmatota archaeon]MEC8446773.1 thiamine diphosphokinase [Candidatus Thermoplasmatota archaeon]|tara:strand:- start:495 stop:1103 length:609 start_codon:yes stop_codon:yes gene_type:complete
MNALIVGNRPLTRNIIQISKDKMIIAADGGADKLLEYEILPDKVIGDFDSISDKAATKLEDWLILNKDIQKTDLEKAVDYAIERGSKKIQIVGWSGGRIDHTLAALGLAFIPNVELIDDKFIVKVISDLEVISGEKGTLFSLIAMPEARVSIDGARWELNHEKLRMSGRGIHNEIGTSGKVSVQCHSGKLLLVKGNFVLHHS